MSPWLGIPLAILLFLAIAWTAFRMVRYVVITIASAVRSDWARLKQFCKRITTTT